MSFSPIGNELGILALAKQGREKLLTLLDRREIAVGSDDEHGHLDPIGMIDGAIGDVAPRRLPGRNAHPPLSVFGPGIGGCDIQSLLGRQAHRATEGACGRRQIIYAGRCDDGAEAPALHRCHGDAICAVTMAPKCDARRIAGAGGNGCLDRRGERSGKIKACVGKNARHRDGRQQNGKTACRQQLGIGVEAFTADLLIGGRNV
ncbi:hypothetical protein IH86_01715 [Sphingobium yanoikuyae]|nr:hypothetical protein IH86_01715 [Sphingobium yanoikuyae]